MFDPITTEAARIIYRYEMDALAGREHQLSTEPLRSHGLGALGAKLANRVWPKLVARRGAAAPTPIASTGA